MPTNKISCVSKMQAEIAELLGGRDRFDPEILTPRLEAYVEEQVAAVCCTPGHARVAKHGRMPRAG